MHRFWKLALEPLVAATAPRRILEIGAEKGDNTGRLLAWAADHDAVVISVDPSPQFDVEEWQREHGERFGFHRTTSLEALPEITDIDLALIDGDHNWYTVIGELRLLDRGERAPVIALHDVGWPYARRDLYYRPDDIPEEFRQPFAHRGIRPDSDELRDPGLNDHLANAIEEGGPRNGVMTAIEDFRSESERDWRFAELPGMHGLGLLVPTARFEENRELRAVLSELSRAPALRSVAREIETQRVWIEIRRAETRQRLLAREEASDELQAQLERTLRELERAEESTGGSEELAQATTALETQQLITERLQEDLGDRDTAMALELDRLRVRAERAEAESSEHARRAAALEQRLEALSREQTTAGLELERISGELASITGQRDSLRVASEQLERQLAELAERERRLTEGARAIEQSAAGAEAARHGAEVAATRAQAGLDAAEHQLGRLRREKAALERRLRAARDDRDRLLTELSERGRGTGLAPVEPGSAGEGRLRAAPAVVSPPESAQEQPPASAEPPEPPLELIERRHFLERVTGLMPPGEQLEGIHDPLALPELGDRRGFLVDRHEAPTGVTPAAQPTVDVVVCVHNAPDDVRRCLWSLTARASYPFHLIIVDDGSNTETATLLDRAAAVPGVELIRNSEPPHGYTIAANLGMKAATADYVVLLNSDTVVTTGWLERMIECGESDERIGILGPLSNAASHQSVPELREGGAWATNELPNWLTSDGMASVIRRASRRERPRLPFINGFCYGIKRSVFEAIGYFDEENFASGYCEENDFSYRAGQAGFELAVVDDGYVFHAKSKSYTVEGRSERAKRNYQIFLDKHDREHINELVRGMEQNAALAPLRLEMGRRLSSPIAAADRVVGSDPLRVVFILPGLGKGGSGGSHSVYQEVRGMRDLGIPATIALSAHAWERAESAYDDAPEVFQPFADLDQLAAITADAQVISATHFKSVTLLARLRELRDDFLPAYYVQDYEPFFMLADHPDHDEAYGSYTAVPGALLFAKTHWLCNALGHAHGVHVAKVEPSIDSTLYRPGHRSGDGPIRVVAMVRRRTPRRQPQGTVDLLERLRREFGEQVETITFGCEDADLRKLTDDPVTLKAHCGLLKRHQVADLMRSTDVFLDFSTYQAFGRTALEAMACGSTAVVPRIGGAAEFARDGYNAVVVDTCSETATYEGLAGLAGDRERVRLLQAGAVQTASRYSIVRAALSEYVLFDNEYRARFGSSSDIADRSAGRP